ncbi:MAG: hypothetical protein KDA84_15220 [Planctomycetaceae bacterium]|nr:hypothetical protein [Planctomycetaceae bacterium]
MQTQSKMPGVVRFLYNHNPFYLLSTCLVLYGLQAAFHPATGELIDPWALMAALSGYTVLSAVTVFLIVQLGKVWEDARSLLLILLFLFMALSVSFDEIVNTDAESGQALLLFGFCLSVGISQWLLTGLNIKLPWLYRGPYYLLLALFFGFPLWVSPEVTELPIEVLRGRIMLFPTIAAIPFLALIPAVRRGVDYTQPNGTPWRWPWVPWPMFVFLALAVCARSYVLSISFDPLAGMNSSFGLYGLVPFLLAGLVLLLEIALVHRVAMLRHLVMLSGFGLLCLAQFTGDGSPGSLQFLDTLVSQAGSPLFLTVCGLIAFYAYAWLRGVRFGEWACLTMLLVAVFVKPDSLRFGNWQDPQLWALQAVGLLSFFISLVRMDSKRCFLGVVICIAAITIAPNLPLPGSLRLVISYHLLLIATLVIGLTFSDRFAMFLRKVGALLLPMSCLFVLGLKLPLMFHDVFLFAYLGVITLIAVGHWWFSTERWYLYGASISVGAILISGGMRLWEFLLFHVGPKALYPLAAGLGCFLLAVAISALKGGAGSRLRSLWKGPPTETMTT